MAASKNTKPSEVPAPSRVEQKLDADQALAAAMPFNEHKRAEHGMQNGHAPVAGKTVPTDPAFSGSTLQEQRVSAKTGAPASIGTSATNAPLEHVRADSTGQALTTNQGVKIADNQNSLKAGLRGPIAMQDFILREKITHFDHERIPERVVHARGSAAHGYFESYDDFGELTMAAPFAAKGKRTPVFARFSTVAGERGSTDLSRDVRGFAVKFYTDAGIWDLVGNNMPVFFIQDPMKFPDLVHAVKPEPNNAMPQAASAHDTFWDFASLMPEINHTLMWVMSDRAIPRSLRTMQGFGVHTFRFVNEAGASVFVKFHWNPSAGTHSPVWDEAMKLSGADPDFHRRDLWDSIEAGNFPEWELAVQVFTEEQAEAFSFDVLDATKLIPEELVPLKPIGKMVLDRNPDNFFAETEQVAFCTQHVVPGIDFSNDPLLQGRNFSYLDTQISRLGGANFHEIPINASIAEVHNNQRDGMHRQSIHRGRVAYEPNSLAGGCPFQAGMQGFVPFPQPVSQDLVRGKPEKFADHYTQATLFWNSQTPVEQAHIIAAFRFELSKVQIPAIRVRVVSMLVNVDAKLASEVASGLGFAVPPAQPKALETPVKPEVTKSAALSLLARPGTIGVKGRKIALLVADGVVDAPLRALHQKLTAEGATPKFVGVRLGTVTGTSGQAIAVEATFENSPAVTFDAVVVGDGEEAVAALSRVGNTSEFLRDQYRHCKTILALGAASTLLDAAEIKQTVASGGDDPGVLVGDGSDASTAAFLAAVERHRHFERELDPPPV